MSERMLRCVNWGICEICGRGIGGYMDDFVLWRNSTGINETWRIREMSENVFSKISLRWWHENCVVSPNGNHFQSVISYFQFFERPKLQGSDQEVIKSYLKTPKKMFMKNHKHKKHSGRICSLILMRLKKREKGRNKRNSNFFKMCSAFKGSVNNVKRSINRDLL